MIYILKSKNIHDISSSTKNILLYVCTFNVTYVIISFVLVIKLMTVKRQVEIIDRTNEVTKLIYKQTFPKYINNPGEKRRR